MGIPVLLAWRRIRHLTSYRDQTFLAALMVIVSVRMVDLLINGWWNNMHLFLAGALQAMSRSLGKEPIAARRQPARRAVAV